MSRISYGAPILRRSRVYDRGDAYLLAESRRLIPLGAVRNPRRGSAVAAVLALMTAGEEIPDWLRRDAADELVALAEGRDPLWWVRQ